jgi:ubiquinone/menaquinone biosynthesis C-methylase UbiE
LYEAKVVVTAVESAGALGVLAALDQGGLTPADLTVSCGLRPDPARALLNVLAGLGLARLDEDGRYSAALNDLAGLPRWLACADAGRALTPTEPAAAAHRPGGAAVLYPSVVRRIGELFAPAPECAAVELARRIRPGARVADLGAGAAPWSLALARHDLRIRVTAVDLPAVVPVTRDVVEAAGCLAQYTFQAGDMFETVLPAGAFDVVLLGNVCHLFDEATNKRLLTMGASLLAPHGHLAIVDVLADDQRRPLAAALYTLSLLGRTEGGGTYAGSDYARWLAAAGCRSVEQIPLTQSLPFTLVTGSAPG